MSSIMKSLRANMHWHTSCCSGWLIYSFSQCCRCINQAPKPLFKVTVLLKLFTLRFSRSVLQLTYSRKWTAAELHWYVKWLHAVKEWIVSVNGLRTLHLLTFTDLRTPLFSHCESDTWLALNCKWKRLLQLRSFLNTHVLDFCPTWKEYFSHKMKMCWKCAHPQAIKM